MRAKIACSRLSDSRAIRIGKFAFSHCLEKARASSIGVYEINRKQLLSECSPPPPFHTTNTVVVSYVVDSN